MNSQNTSLRPIAHSSALRPPGLAMDTTQQPGIGASLRQKLLPAGTTGGVGVGIMPSGNAGAVLEHLKRHADKMMEEQESTRHDVNIYREKLAELHATLSRTEQDLARERQENVVLRAKAKDDAAQVSYVLGRIKMLTALQESNRSCYDHASLNVGRADQYRHDLDVKMLGQERNISDVHMTLHAVTAARDQLSVELRHAQGLTADLQSQLRKAAEELSCKDAALERQAVDAAAKERAAEAHASSLQTLLSTAKVDLAASRGHAEQLRHDLDAERSRSAKEASQLMERYQEAQQRITLLDGQLSAALDEQKASREQASKLEARVQALAAAEASAREELASIRSTLADRTSELKNAEQLSRRLEAMQAELAGREADLQRMTEESADAASRIEELTSQEVALREDLSARVAEVARLEEEHATERERIQAKENELAAMLAAAQAMAAAETARAAAAIAAAEQRLREAERAGEARLERFKERTSRENDEMRRRVRAEAEAEAKRLAEELKKATAALQAAESLAVQGAAEREAAFKAELQAFRKSASEELAALKNQAAEAIQKAEAQAQESRLTNERDLAKAHAEAEAAVAELRLRLEAEHQRERDEWDKEMEAVTAAEKADAEQRAHHLVATLRAELEAKAVADLRDAAVDAERQRHELNERVASLNARLQELENGSASGDRALESARGRISKLEQQLVTICQEGDAARAERDSEIQRLRDEVEQQRTSFGKREDDMQAQQRRLEHERFQLDKDWAVKDEQLQTRLQRLESDVLEARRERDRERDNCQRQERERVQLQAQEELERLRLQEALEDLRRQLESKSAAEQQQRQQQQSGTAAQATSADQQPRFEGQGQPSVAEGALDMDQDGGDVAGPVGAGDTTGVEDTGAREELDGEPAASRKPHEEATSQEPTTLSQRHDQPPSECKYDKGKPSGGAKPARRKESGKQPAKANLGGVCGPKAPADADAVTEHLPNSDMEPRPLNSAGTAAAGACKPHGTTAKDSGAGSGSVAKHSSAAARGKAAPIVSKLTAELQPSTAAKAAAKCTGGAGASNTSNADNAKKGSASKAPGLGSREPLAPQVGANNTVNARAKADSSMPPPPAKVPKAAAPPARLPATTTATGATGAATRATAARKAVSGVRRTHDEFADLTTESEMDDPSQSQDVTVTGHANKRRKTGTEAAAAAPSQMPAATKGGRFSLFKGMSMGMSVQTTTAEAGGGNEVSSAFGAGVAGTRKKGSGIPASKQLKGGASDVMDLFAGMSPYPKK